jgi:hypothetical protein
MKPVNAMSRKEFAAYVHTLMGQNGIDVILSGGSCVSIYSEETYVSGDLDFIRTGIESFRCVRSVMMANGFIEENRYFKHPDTCFYVEFPSGPPTIGEDPILEYNMLETECGSLKLLTPTDCVRDRLCAFYYWNDQEALQQALLITERHTIEISDIKAWSGREGKSDLFRVFLDHFRRG